jgi:uncharacterized protein (DUF58 family)
MNIRPAISTPLPWLTMLAGRALARPGRLRQREFWLPRSLSITREGWWFIGVLFFIALAAINTANNLLYLVVATLLSLIIISGVISESTLRGVSVSRTLPRRIFKGSPVVARLAIENRKRFLPSFSFKVSELRGHGVKAEPVYVLKLKGGAARTSAYTFERRGVVKLRGFKVETRFPFGLFLKGRVEESPAEAIVYPSIKAGKRLAAWGGHPGAGGAVSFGGGRGAELRGLRDYTIQDDSRFIHWKAAARSKRLLMKEFEREGVKRVTVVFENRQGRDEAEFEEAVDEAASAVNRLIGEGYAVGLKTLASEHPPRDGPAQLHVLLHELALIRPAEGAGKPRLHVIRS